MLSRLIPKICFVLLFVSFFYLVFSWTIFPEIGLSPEAFGFPEFVINVGLPTRVFIKAFIIIALWAVLRTWYGIYAEKAPWMFLLILFLIAPFECILGLYCMLRATSDDTGFSSLAIFFIGLSNFVEFFS